MYDFFFCIYREELRGISRGKNAKDVDWSEVAATFEDAEQVAEKPEPIKIPVEELLQKVRKTSKTKIKAGLSTVDKNSKYIF